MGLTDLQIKDMFESTFESIMKECAKKAATMDCCLTKLAWNEEKGRVELQTTMLEDVFLKP